jgi:hypothetical protein
MAAAPTIAAMAAAGTELKSQHLISQPWLIVFSFGILALNLDN